ncbi:MAG: amidohydrolase, partial [Candidatus Neomarinimicrobiota bacterium]
MKEHIVMQLLTVFLFLTAIFPSGCQQKKPKADLVLKNGNFFTVNKLRPKVEAIAIRGNRILATGKDEEIDRFIGENTRIIDLNGMFGCPGFNDAHLHFLSGG